MKARLYILAVAAFVLAGCSLDQEPGGSTITKDQYDQMDDKVRGTILGVYSKIYAYGGEHDYFGQKSIDLSTDLLSGDVAMKSQRYGWFVGDEQMNTYSRSSYFWSYYYNIIRLCNIGLNVLDAEGGPNFDITPDLDINKLTDEEYEMGYYRGQLLTMRGWAYAGLQRFFCEAISGGRTGETLSVPIYTDSATIDDSILGAERATAEEVHMLRVQEDLLSAIKYFEAFNKIDRGENKLEVNIDVARMTLAYACLNEGNYAGALKQVDDLIGSTSASVLPQEDVLTNGFNNKDTKSWIWGLDVTVENTTSLASFFGQVDIYSYSYASAGDVKGIDANLYKEITDLGWDIREGWWNNLYNSNTSSYSTWRYAPDGKFFSAKSKDLSGDRDWLSDLVYMRVEEAYLIGAEAAWRNNEHTLALGYLRKVTDERVKDGKESDYTTYIAGLESDSEALGEAIRYNWRVELWGEGFGLQTFRRWGKAVTRGDNHLYKSTQSISPWQIGVLTFEIPSSETMYNPFIRQTTELTTKQ